MGGGGVGPPQPPGTTDTSSMAASPLYELPRIPSNVAFEKKISINHSIIIRYLN